MDTKKFIASISLCLFLIGCNRDNASNEDSDTLPNLEFIINKTACLFGQGSIKHELKTPAISTFIEKTDRIISQNNDSSKKAEFINCLVKGKVENEYITPEFTEILRNALLEYDPTFDKKSDQLNNERQELTDYYKKFFKKSDSFFPSIYKFYGNSNFQRDQKFSVYLYPSNTANAGIPAFYGDNVFLQLMPHNRRAIDIGEILHEICNRLYVDDHKTFFFEHQSQYAIAAYLLMDEILATAIGNRLAYSHMNNGAVYDGAPSENKYINDVSKAITPMVSEYLEKYKKLDEKLLNKAINVLEKDCKDSNVAFNVILKKINLITEKKELFDKYSEIFSREFDTSAAYADTKLPYSVIFIGQTTGDPSLDQIRNKLPGRLTGDFLFVTMDADKKIYVIICSNDGKKVENAIKILKEQKVASDGFSRNL